MFFFLIGRFPRSSSIHLRWRFSISASTSYPLHFSCARRKKTSDFPFCPASLHSFWLARTCHGTPSGSCSDKLGHCRKCIYPSTTMTEWTWKGMTGVRPWGRLKGLQFIVSHPTAPATVEMKAAVMMTADTLSPTSENWCLMGIPSRVGLKSVN